MGFHEVRFPTGIGYGSSGGPSFNTSIIENDSGHEERIARWENARRIFNAKWGIKSYDDLYDVYKFFIAMQGALSGFRFKDWIDFTSAANGRDAYAEDDVTIAQGDGTETDFQLIKKYAYGNVTRTRNIQKPVDGEIAVAVNGVSQTLGSDYTMDHTTGIITFDAGSIPANGHDITAGYEFDVPVRFGEGIDRGMRISLDHFDSGNIPDIPLYEIKDATIIPGEFPYGGAYDHGNVSANFDVTILQGRVHTFAPTTSGINANLEDLTNIPSGYNHLVLINEGSYSLTVKDDGGATVIEVPSNGRATLFVAINASSTKFWVGK
jgi:uncharacterized protein (TIGR02217 family)